MPSKATQTQNDNRQRGVRLGVWVAVFAAFAVAVMVLISLPPRSTSDSLPQSTPADTTMTTEAAGREVAPAYRSRVPRRQQSPSTPEYVYQGRTLSEWVADLYSTNQAARQAAHEAFRAMGDDASPAISSIAELLHSSEIPNAAAWALVNIGTNSLPTLIEALTNGNRTARMEVAGAIGFLRDAAEEAVPALVECLRHEDASVRANAIASLQAIPKRPDLAVPALTVCLTDTDARVRGNAATTIRNFGRAAESAIPVLLRVARGDNDAHVRTRAAESVRAISPERADAEGL